MGIGITSNSHNHLTGRTPPELVSIPNGDRHYLELNTIRDSIVIFEFQSPMGIGITSNPDLHRQVEEYRKVSIPNGDRHYLEQYLDLSETQLREGFNPQWG